jgi:hypothetical protein
MAYEPKALSALAYANGFTLWHYRTGDAAAQIDTTGYFNPASGVMRVGDFVFFNAGLGGATPAHGVVVVVSNDNGVVDVANATAFVTGDTD